MAHLYENATNAIERRRGLHLIDKPDEAKPDEVVPSRSSDVIYQIAAVVVALVLLATMV
jgi:hypothetical protein